MPRKDMLTAGYSKVYTNNGGVITATNAMSKESARAQRTFMGSAVVAEDANGNRKIMTKGQIFKEAKKKQLKNFIDRF